MKSALATIGLWSALCMFATGCSAVYVKQSLSEERLEEVPELVGHWLGSNPRQGTQEKAEVIREGLGLYRLVHPQTGDFVDTETGERTIVRVKVYRVGGQLYVEPIITQGHPPSVPLPRLAWIDDVTRLLILAVRLTRGEQVLKDRERALIKSVVAAEAKRPDAPGQPMELSTEQVESLIDKYRGDCPGVAELVADLRDPANAAHRTRLFKRIWQVAVCDGPASDAEVEFAQNFADETGMSEEDYRSVSQRFHRQGPPVDKLDEAFRLLELPRSASAEEVKRAYKKKAREYHPDAHAGVAVNLKRLAAERFSMLSAAKETLLAALEQGSLVALDPAGRLVPAADLPEQICCFVCESVRAGVPLAESNVARCSRCLALLYQAPDVAAELIRGKPS